MRIVIAGGKNKADFLIGSLLKKKHHLVVINDDPAYCKYLAETHKIPVIYGDPCKHYILEDAGVYGYDLIIALKPTDADNLAICQAAKRLFHIKRDVAIVANPINVDIFKKLGVQTAISATYMVARAIEQASTIESLISSLPVEQDKIILTELLIDVKAPVCNKQIMNIDFPEDIIIGCILRGENIIVPSGKTEILPHDKLIILSPPEKQNQVIAVITGGK